MRTEGVSARYVDLDSWSSGDMIEAMYEAQLFAAAAVREALADITAAVDDAVAALRGGGGRLVYAGAGTSGRIGVLDGTELWPTFGWPADRLVFALAGGLEAMVESAEGAEDDEAEGSRAMTGMSVSSADVVVGVAASGTTPFTIGALRAASAAGAVTVAVASNPQTPLFEAARHGIVVRTGSEVIAGSTRMKAGTAQKIVLNLFSTAVMVKLGRVYKGEMVEMRAGNAKLRQRAERMVERLAGCSPAAAARFMEQTEGDIKTAVLLGFGLSLTDASALLERCGGNLRACIERAKAGRSANSS